MIEAAIPVRIESTPNKREHWAAKAKRTAIHRASAFYALRQISKVPPALLRMRVRLTRVAPRAMDSDNLAAGFKAVRDGIADWLGIDDGSSRIVWEYSQTKGGVREYAVKVQIVEWSAEC